MANISINPDALLETLVAVRAWHWDDRGQREHAAALHAAAERLFAVPEPPSTATEQEFCVKCGHAQIGMSYHRNGYVCSHSYRESHHYEALGEHLHRHCQQCHFEWIDACRVL